MLTKGAIGNLINRYRAVLKKCHLINTFGSLAVASMLVLGGAGVAGATAYKGVASDVDASLITDGKAIGGWEKPSATDLTTALTDKDFSMQISGGNLEDIIGGQYFSNAHGQTVIGAKDSPYEVDEVSTSINGTTVTVDVVGGHKTNNAYETYLKTDTVKLEIKDITFAAPAPGVGNVPEGFIIGGDLLKSGNAEGGNVSNGAESTIGKTELTISGGSIAKPVIGGSTALHFYGPSTGYTGLTAHVDEAVTKITGGNITAPVIAGGFAYGTKAESTVGKANLTISGNNVAGDLYAGGLEGGTSVIGATVDSASITVENAAVGNIYGNNALIQGAGGSGNSIDSWQYSPVAADTVKTDLTLTNATAQNVVLNHADSTLTFGGTSEIKNGLEFNGSSVVLADKDSEGNALTTVATINDDSTIFKSGTIEMNGQKLVLNVNGVKGLTGAAATELAQSGVIGAAGMNDGVTITGGGELEINVNKADGKDGRMCAISDGAHVINVDKLTIKADDDTIAVRAVRGDKTITAGSVIINTDASAFASTDAGSSITVQEFDKLDVTTGSNGHAVRLINTSVTKPLASIKLIGKTNSTIDLRNDGRSVIQQEVGTIEISGGSITLESTNTNVAKYSDGAVAIQAGDADDHPATLTIKATDALKITASEGANAISIAKGKATLEGGEDSEITGNIALAGGETSITLGEGSKIDGRTTVAAGAELSITGASITGQSGSAEGGAIYNAGTVNFSGTNTFTGNTDSTGANDI